MPLSVQNVNRRWGARILPMRARISAISIAVTLMDARSIERRLRSRVGCRRLTSRAIIVHILRPAHIPKARRRRKKSVRLIGKSICANGCCRSGRTILTIPRIRLFIVIITPHRLRLTRKRIETKSFLNITFVRTSDWRAASIV